jgi:hypothetical protein
VIPSSFADGVYHLNGAYLQFDVPDVTLRSASGNRGAVILDGNYLTTEIIQIVASNVTIADLALREAYHHPIHVMSTGGSHTNNTLIYNVHIRTSRRTLPGWRCPVPMQGLLGPP